MIPYLAAAPVIETQRLTLRPPRMADYPAFRAFFTSDRARFIGGPGDEYRAWRGFAHVAGMWALKGVGSFIFSRHCEETPIGMSGPWVPEDWPEREIGWTVWDPEAEGKGYAAEAATAARAYAYGTLGWTTAVSYIDAGNARSIALAERLGCTPDPAALAPEADGKSVLVYRHPAPEGRA